MSYPFPDTLDFTMNDILVFAGLTIVLSIFFVCSEDILEWIGIPNDVESKERIYDIPMGARTTSSQLVVALTTPTLMAMGLVAIVSIAGLGPIGAYCLWVYILWVYHSRYVMYGVSPASPEYILFGTYVFLLAFLTWQPGEMWVSLSRATWYGFLTWLIRVLVGFISAAQTAGGLESYTMIPPLQHIMWDPLVSFRFYRQYIQWTSRMIRDQLRAHSGHED